MDQQWYKKSNFRSLVDMHITNVDDRLLADFDAEAYAENMKVAGIDAAYVYSTNCQGLCLYPSKVGYLHQEVKKRDLFGQVITALKKRGIRPLGYINHWSSAAYDHHPEWREVDKQGKGHRDHSNHQGRYGTCCFNSPFRDLMLAQVHEVCSSYPIEALWIDQVVYSLDVCYCEHCRRQYKEETGYDLPEVYDWADPNWRTYVNWKSDKCAKYLQDIATVARKAIPGLPVSTNCAAWKCSVHVGWGSRCFEAITYTSGDFYTNIQDQTVDCKFLRNASQVQPFEYMVPKCPDLIYHTGSKSFEQIRQQAFGSFLHGGAFLLIDAIDPVGTLNRKSYEMFRQVRDEIAPYWSEPSFLKGTYYNDVAIYFNFDSAGDQSINGIKVANTYTVKSPLFRRMKNMNINLSKRHIQYEIICDLHLDRLQQYPVIVLSELTTLTQKEADAFREYVKNGGRLYISGHTGILNHMDIGVEEDNTLRRKDFLLCDVMGVSLAGKNFPYDSCYVQGREANELFSENDLAYPTGTKCAAPMITAHDDTTVLAYAKLPYSNHEDAANFITAISDPPFVNTDAPILTEHTYGKGTCVYCPLLLEDDVIQPGPAKLWLDILDRLLKGVRAVEIDAPYCVEISTKTVADTVVFSLLNTQFGNTRAPAGETVINVSNKLIQAESLTVFPHGTVSLEHTDNGCVVKASGLPEYAVVTLKK